MSIITKMRKYLEQPARNELGPILRIIAFGL